MTRLRRALCGLLQEDDATRPLDSLESMVVHTYLAENGYPDPPLRLGEDTIERWVAWAATRSEDS